jgi:sugar O-acyltransferase (sialic acid O-acetyltransferase NeuD family)
MANIVIFGAGNIAQLAHYYFTNDSSHAVAAFTVDREFMKEESFCGLPVIAFQDVEKEYPPEQFSMFIAVSYAKVNKVRTQKYFEAKDKGYSLASYISSKATIFDNIETGDNCFILEDNTIQPFVKIGNNVTLWSGNHIGHHSQIGDNCFISSHVVVSGGVIIEPYCFLGVNATLRDHIVIASECVIGPGAILLKDTVEKGVYTGVAAELSKVPSDRLRGL